MWNLVHNGLNHNESIYRKWEHDQKLKPSQKQASTRVVDIVNVDENADENSGNENNSDYESDELVDDSANLCMIEKNKGLLFNRYELADVLIKSQFEKGQFT